MRLGLVQYGVKVTEKLGGLKVTIGLQQGWVRVCVKVSVRVGVRVSAKVSVSVGVRVSVAVKGKGWCEG